MFAKKYKSIITSINNPVEGIYTLEFKSLGKKFKYHPGQFLHLAIDEDYDGIGQWPESRCFSMQSNPGEETIKITYALKGRFTNLMGETLKEGSSVWLKLPYGNLFTQQHNKYRTVFIAGGTGITPFLSLFTHEMFKEYSNPQIYIGFRSESYNIYQNELSGIKNNTASLKVFYEDFNGIIDIKQIMKENNSGIYFISGPPVMIKNFKKSLISYGIPTQNILTDEWE